MEIFQTPDAKALGLPFSSAVRAGETLYLSGRSAICRAR